MFRAILFSAVLVASVAVGNEVQTADACGVKMGARRGPNVNRSATSQNPSKILIVGSRDGALVKKLRTAHHNAEYASTVSDAKHSRYDLIIADESQMDAARSRFSNTQVLKKKSDSNATVATAETMLARTATGRSQKLNLVATAEARAPVATGTEGINSRTATETGSDRVTTPVLASRVAAEAASEKPVRVAEVTTPRADPIRPNVEPVEKPVKAAGVEEPVERPAAKGNWTRSFQFGTNKTELNESATRKLTANATWLQENPGSSIVIEGHTDSVGDEAYNVDLSERRANVARDFMISFGIDASRISVEAKGEQEPAFEPSTSGKNRRIVLIKK